jgi:hypothetical protein
MLGDLENRIGRGEERQYNILWCEQGIKKKKGSYNTEPD